jgi:hypothetical protein
MSNEVQCEARENVSVAKRKDKTHKVKLSEQAKS